METILPNLREELLVACHVSACLHSLQRARLRTLLSSEQADEQYAGSIHCEQCTNRVEFSREYLQNDERERELSYSRTDVRSLERSLCSTDLNHLVLRENDGASTMKSQPIPVSGMAALEHDDECSRKIYKVKKWWMVVRRMVFFTR